MTRPFQTISNSLFSVPHTVTPGWHYDDSGPAEKDRQLLVEYYTIVKVNNNLLRGCRFPHFQCLR